MSTYSIKCSDETIQKIKSSFKESQRISKNPYIDFEATVENCIISVYTSQKVVFQGKDALVWASSFDPSLCADQEVVQNVFPQAGSDEVGTGDYFGCVCVCACLIEEKDKELLKSCGVQDSKQLSDVQIRKIAPLLMKQLPYSLLIVDNEKYNQIHNRCNLNQIKAILHNQAYVHLKKKCQKLPKLSVVDQFEEPKSYYDHLQDQNTIITGLHFETKAENKYPAVACASIIARYAFICKWDEMEQHYGMNFSKGASSLCDQDAVNFVKRFGWDELKRTAKLHFKNTEKVQSMISKRK